MTHLLSIYIFTQKYRKILENSILSIKITLNIYMSFRSKHHVDMKIVFTTSIFQEPRLHGMEKLQLSKNYVFNP